MTGDGYASRQAGEYSHGYQKRPSLSTKVLCLGPWYRQGLEFGIRQSLTLRSGVYRKKLGLRQGSPPRYHEACAWELSSKQSTCQSVPRGPLMSGLPRPSLFAPVVSGVLPSDSFN